MRIVVADKYDRINQACRDLDSKAARYGDFQPTQFPSNQDELAALRLLCAIYGVDLTHMPHHYSFS